MASRVGNQTEMTSRKNNQGALKLYEKIQALALLFSILILIVSYLIEHKTFIWLSATAIALAVISFFFNTYIELIIRAKRINRYQPQPTKKV